MAKSLVVEIRDFLSLREIAEDLEERIAQYSLMKEEYSRELGSCLRNMGEEYRDEELFKSLSLDKTKGGRKKEGKAASCWVTYKGLSLSSTDEGEMELLFEAIEELGKKVDGLVEAKKAVEGLMKVGLSENLRYRVYIRDGVPQKIVLRPGEEGAERFALNMVFSTIP